MKKTLLIILTIYELPIIIIMSFAMIVILLIQKNLNEYYFVEAARTMGYALNEYKGVILIVSTLFWLSMFFNFVI